MTTRRFLERRPGGARRWWTGLAVVLALGAVATPADAQEKQRRGMDPEERMRMMQERLELTADQVAALEPIFSEHDAKRRELFQSRSEERQQMRDQMRALQAELDEELIQILTEEQMQRLLELREQRRQQFRQGRRDGQRGAPPSEG